MHLMYARNESRSAEDCPAARGRVGAAPAPLAARLRRVGSRRAAGAAGHAGSPGRLHTTHAHAHTRHRRSVHKRVAPARPPHIHRPPLQPARPPQAHLQPATTASRRRSPPDSAPGRAEHRVRSATHAGEAMRPVRRAQLSERTARAAPLRQRVRAVVQVGTTHAASLNIDTPR